MNLQESIWSPSEGTVDCTPTQTWVTFCDPDPPAGVKQEALLVAALQNVRCCEGKSGKRQVAACKCWD